MKYTELDLDPRLQESIKNLNYVEMTPIQEKSFQPVVSGQDVAGLAQTGTGKTAAFLIPLIERILRAENQPEHPHAFKDWTSFNTILILVPTRELADQIHENITKLGHSCGIKSYPLYGGTGYEKQKEALGSQLQFIVSTPGRLIDLYKEHFVDFKKIKAIVFDEADRMFDMGFKDDMKYILSRIEKTRQFLVFSATLNFDVLNTAYQFGSEPVEINISKDVAKADNVTDALFHIGHEEKPQHLLSLIKRENPKQTIIFTNFKNNVDRIAGFLTQNGIPAMGISSLMSQAQRTLVISKFKADNNQNVLVATDVAARGLDISDVDLVINFELPQDSESYVHRIGRTGRAGQTGKAFSLVCDRDVESLSRIEEYTKKKIEIGFLEDHDLIKDFKPFSDQEPQFKKSFDKKQRSSKPQFNSKSDRKSRPERSERFERSEKSYKSNKDQNPQEGNGSKDFTTKNKFDAKSQFKRGDGKSDFKKNDKHQKSSGYDPKFKNNHAKTHDQKSHSMVKDSKFQKSPPRHRNHRTQDQSFMGKVKKLIKSIFG